MLCEVRLIQGDNVVKLGAADPDQAGRIAATAVRLMGGHGKVEIEDVEDKLFEYEPLPEPL